MFPYFFCNFAGKIEKKAIMKKTIKKLLSRAAMTLALMVLTTATAGAQVIHDYIDENGNPNSHGAVVLTGSSDMATIGEKGEMTWYVVTENISYDDMLTIKGDVNLILYDGKTMKVDGVYNYHNGISLDGTLTIYGQTYGTGTLNVNGYYYGIYTEDEKCDLTICGGTVTATGDKSGIYTEECDLTISGGTVTATGTGTGIYTESCNLTIKGGTVNATGTGTDGVGIDVRDRGSVTFSGSIDYGIQFGATVTATGSKFGIAAGSKSGITLSGGTVTANGGYSGDVTIDLPGGYAYTDKTYDGGIFYLNGTLTDKQKGTLNGVTLTATAVIAYIDDDGKTQYRDASKVTRLFGDESETPLHGGRWYVVHGTVNFDHTIAFNGGAVCIILEDGATLNIGADDKKIDGPGINCGSSGRGIDNLFIYGQSGGTGTLNVYTTGAENHAIHAEYVTISGGHVNATTDVGYAIYADGDVAITGSTVNATSIAANGTIALGWTRATDRITANSYTSGNNTVSIDGFLTNGTTVYSGTVTDLTTLAGKTLQPYGYSLTANEADGNRWTTFYSSQTGFHIETANAYAYTAKYDADNSQLTLTKLGTDIPAGTAVIIASATSPVMLAIDGTLGNYSGPTNNLHGVDVQTMKSSLYPSSDKSGTFYVMGKKGSDFGFFQYTADYMPARKAYLLVSGSGAPLAPGLKMVFGDGETNSLSLIPSPSREGGAGAWYTLDGRRLQGKPTQKGLYIHGNIKVVIK